MYFSAFGQMLKIVMNCRFSAEMESMARAESAGRVEEM
jgi:hypothetical protein